MSSSSASALGVLKDLARIGLRSRAGRRSDVEPVFGQTVGRNEVSTTGFSDGDHIMAAARWLASAQDATHDGGVAGHFSLYRGWNSSYPETTGYLIPTFLGLAKEPGMEAFEERAANAIAFLLRHQLADGGFPAGQVHQDTTAPSVFNSAQIICGLVAWHRHTKDQQVLDAAVRAADWLRSMQDADGGWRRHVYHNLPTSYTAFASCWLAELGRYIGEERYRAAALRHLLWVLAFVDPDTGWFDRCGFTSRQHDKRIGLTHTIAYTLAGVLMTSQILGIGQGIATVERASGEIASRLKELGWLPGILDSRWRRRAGYACVTGTAQMALIWMQLFEGSRDVRWRNAAMLAIETTKSAQAMRASTPEIRGAIPGSDPVWGGYMRLAYPNWAAKFFVDALIEKRRALVLGELGGRGGSVHREAHLSQIVTSPVGGRCRQTKDRVTFFPDWQGDPYITELLTALAHQGWRCEIVGRQRLVWALIAAICGRGTVHLHWFEGFNPKRSRIGGLVAWLYLPALWLAGRRGRLIWTVHNLTPHEGYAPFLGPVFLRLLARSSSRLLVHFDETREAVARQFLVSSKVVVTPPASYGHALGPPIDRATARASISSSLTEANRLFVQIGSMRGYKQPATTVSAFRDAAPSSAMLMLAGPCVDESIRADVIRAAGDDPRIILRLERLADKDLVAVLSAADWSICPYVKIDNPGALNLSLSYNCPVIAPALPQVCKLAIGHLSILYPPGGSARLRLGEAILVAATRRESVPRNPLDSDTVSRLEQARLTAEQYLAARLA